MLVGYVDGIYRGSGDVVIIAIGSMAHLVFQPARQISRQHDSHCVCLENLEQQGSLRCLRYHLD